MKVRYPDDYGNPAIQPPPATVTVMTGPIMLAVYPFPVRPGVMAELHLPADLTPGEAERLGRFVATLANSELQP